MKHTRLVLATALIMLFAIGIASAVTLGEPSASFSASGTKGAYPFSVIFTGTAINMIEPFSYHWDFGDGSGADKTSVNVVSPITHVYLHPGKYTVKLSVYDIGFPVTTWVSDTKSDYITVTNQPPVVSISGSPLTINARDRVGFSSVVSGDGITSYVWNFGDGKSTPPPGAEDQILRTTSNLYEANGTYTAHLLVTNDGGTTTSNGVTITVHPKAPVADFEATSARTGAKPFAVTFEDKTIYIGTIDSFFWTFGDGGTSTEQNPMHVYVANGTYTVGLTVTTISGPSTETKTGYIVVLNSPVVCPTPVPTVEPTSCPTPVPTQCPTPGSVPTTIGEFRNGQWFLYNGGNFIYGQQGDIPLLGDWNGDGIDTVGVYRTGVFYLRNTNTGGNGDLTFLYGNSVGDTPIVGDWNGDGIDTIGIIRSGVFYLRNTNTAGIADITFGAQGDVPAIS